MVRLKLHNILFLVFLCNANGQYDNSRRRPWCDRFVPIGRYWDLHDDLDRPQNIIDSSPRFILLAPDLLRTDSQENIYLQADRVSDPIIVSILIQDFTKATTFLEESVTLNQANGFNILHPIQLSSDLLNREEKRNQFVNLKVTFGDSPPVRRLLMVTFHSGYIFIQTDKPIYNPGDTVRFRAFVSSPAFKAFESSITIDIENPDGVVVKQVSRTRAVNGVLSETFPLSEYVNEGMWIVTAKFDHWEQNTFTSQFQVKKYELPAFNVTLTPKKSFLSLDDSELEVAISASYLYGQPVQGTAYVVFGVKINKEMRRLPSVKEVSNLDGGIVKLSMEEIRSAYPNTRDLVGNSVYVKASVLTKTGSDLVEAEKVGIKIVESPYVLLFQNMPKYFKPGLPFDFTIQVSHHDGSPAHNVRVKLNLLDAPLHVTSGNVRASINMPSDIHPQTITAETMQDGLRPEQQARQEITVQPYTPQNQDQQNYLHISTGSSTVSLGQTISMTFTVIPQNGPHRESIKHITYLILSKGKIISVGRMDITGQKLTRIGLMVTRDMMPSFRVVAYYRLPWVGQEEVVSDSIWIDVVDSCVGGLTVGPVGNPPNYYTPGKTFRFQIRGEPVAKVSLVTVDNAVYLINKDRLTQKKIWDVVEHGDIGCTRGGGRDAKSVFTDAGLLYSSSAGFHTPDRRALQCSGSARRRGSAELLRRKAQLGRFKGCRMARKHRMPGMPGMAGMAGPSGREGYIGTSSTEDLLTVAKEVMEEEREYLNEAEVYLRSKFYESWLWMDVNLPNEAEGDGLASLNIEEPLPDSITEWGVLAVSASPQTGFCVAEPYNFKAWKPFFVDLKLPHSVARNEQVEIKAVIHNYGSEELYVRVVLKKTEGMCSIAFKDRHTQEVTVPAGSSIAVPYTIVPLVVGKHPLEVVVLARDAVGEDRVQKFLRVVLDGVQKTEVWSVMLNPSAVGGTQTVRVGKIELESVVPNSKPETYINIRGNVLADSIENSIKDDSLASLIRMPGGCVEQNLASITLPLIATLYLDRTNNWESVGVERRADALKYIKRGYENQLAYRRSDGSYPPYQREGASTWYSLILATLQLSSISVLMVISIHPIHPFSSAYPGPGRGGRSLSREAQASLSPATSSSSSRGTPRRSQASREI